MNGLFAVYKREVALYFRSFIAYVIVFAVMGIIGFLFNANLAYVLQQSAVYGQAATVQITPLVAQNFGVLTFLMFLIAPLITMRLLAEETREGTLEVMMTLPMSDGALVVGKFLAAWTLFTVMVVFSLVHVGMLARLGSFNVAQVVFLYLGVWFYGGATLAISLIWSAITEDQLVAGFLGAATVLTLMLTDNLAVMVGSQQGQGVSGLADFVRLIGFNTHYSNLANGIVRAEDIAYFILMIIVALFVTTLIVGTRRWRAS